MRFSSTGLAISLLVLAAGAVATEAKPKPAAAGANPAQLSRSAAERIALTAVPDGHIKEGELEKENGLLVWSFDISRPNTRNVTEVQVDAISGKVVSTAMETPAEQAKEAKADKGKTASKSGASR